MEAFVAGLVGRDEEFAAVEEFIFGGSAARCLVIHGVAGIGKTTLWQAGVDACRSHGWQIRSSRPGEAEASFSLAVLADLLEGVSPELLAGLPPPQRGALEIALLLRQADEEESTTHAVAAGFLSVLRLLAGTKPLVVAVDDVQWADPASAAALGYALRRLGAEPIRFLFAQRTGVPAPRALSAAGMLGVELGPLSLGALQRVLRSHLERPLPRPVVVRIHKESGGNPFFGLELGRAFVRRGLAELPEGPLPLPSHLGELVRERLEALPEATRDAIGLTAALADPRLEVLEAAGIAGDLDAAFRTGVVTIDGKQVRFTHPLLAAHAYEALSPDRRRDVHRVLAGLVPDREERARHLALGTEGPSEEVAQVLEGAARLASARGAPAAAATLVDLAARRTPGTTERVRRQIDAEAYRFVAGETAAARAALEPLVEALPPGRERARALLYLGMTREDDLPAAAGYLERAAVDADGDDRLLASIRIRQADFAGMRGDFMEALAYGRAGLESAERSGERRAIALALPELAAAEKRVGVVTPGLLERAVELQESIPDLPPGYKSARRVRAISLIAADRLDAARNDLERAHRHALEQGDEFEEPIVLSGLAEVECLAGDLDAALQHAEEGVGIAEQLGLEQTLNTLRCRRALIAAHLGREEARAEALAALRSAEAIDDGLGQIRARAALGFLELSRGGMAAAVEYLRPLPELTPDVPASEFRFLPDLIEALLALGEREQAETLLAPFEGGSGLRDTSWTRACSQRCRGLLLAAQQDISGALTALEAALVECEQLPMPLERARTLLALGQVQRRAKQRAAARESLQAALAIFEQLGTPLWAEKARAELARISGRRPASEGLTDTERKIADLVAEGKTNKEVAAALFLSVHTVGDNLKRVYRKLGVRSRTELARRLTNG